MSSSKVFATASDAVADVPNGSTLMIGGHLGAGVPEGLVRALLDRNVTDLTCICGPWDGGAAGLQGASMLVAKGRARRLITVAPSDAEGGGPATDLWRSEGIEVQVVSPGTLAERIRAAGAGLGGILLPLEDAGPAGDGLETRTIEDAVYALEAPLAADFALLHARAADTLGNLVYRTSQRNWNPVMAVAARTTIVEVEEVVLAGELDPELVITPGVYVNRVVPVGTRTG
ncbi:MAG: CoA transferase subunit A [Dehalococcoidia bacterium]|nr:CoA transferase subunit A [Dehalococcoidia bacterium]